MHFLRIPVSDDNIENATTCVPLQKVMLDPVIAEDSYTCARTCPFN